MLTTGRDWAVTATQEISRCIDSFTAARTADLTQSEVLRACWAAYRAAAAAVGAVVESELREGIGMSTIADLLGFSDAAQAESRLAPLRSAAAERLHARLPDA